MNGGLDKPVGRRRFLQVSGCALAAGMSLPGRQVAAGQESSKMLRKAVKIGMVREGETLKEKFQLVKQLGFDGIELDSPNSLDPDEVLKARDEVGLPIHGVVDSVHWRATLSHPDPDVRAKGLEALKQALRDAKLYGGSTVLLVPAVVNEKVSYDQAYKRSQAEIRKAIPLAEKLGIRIAIENVWNKFLLSPLEEARYLDELGSPMVGAYFDVGNIVAFGWPEHWIHILGKRIVKLDIKDYSRKIQNEQGMYKGFGVKLGEGDVNWPAVMQALRDIGYQGWATAEVGGGGRDRLAEIAQRMDRCFAS